MNKLLCLGKTLGNTLREIQKTWSLAGDFKSRLRLSSDFVLYRILKIIDLKSYNKERTIRCSNGTILTYRLNRGDIQSIREVFLDESYRLPFSLEPNVIVDLGANIGLTSIWLYQHYGCEKIVAVEPDPSNASLARRNFMNNGINVKLIEAAVGPTDGTVAFDVSRESNIGQVVQIRDRVKNGKQVKMISMNTLLANFSKDEILDLVKMDIEGGEQQLLSGDLAWLSRTKSMIVEFHPCLVDYPGLIKVIEAQGLSYIPANTVFHHNMDAFIQNELKSA